MSNTRNLFMQIRRLLDVGAMKPEEFPLEDIIGCVRMELESNKSTFDEAQYFEVFQDFTNYCEGMQQEKPDKDELIMFLDGLLICLSTVSRAVKSLANREYWEYKHKDNLDDPEIREIIDNIGRKGDISLLNYDFVDEYNEAPCEVLWDEGCNMAFVPYKGRRMYFPRGWDEQKIINYYHSVVSEQDKRSPHCYDEEGFNVKVGDVIVDVGAAEGIFALDYMDKAGKVFLFEAADDWMEALQHTFAQDKDKVEIIRGYISDHTDGNDNIALDDALRQIEINYIKMDIEGYEKAALTGAIKVFENAQNLRCAICSYHCHEDEEWITDFLTRLGYETKHSKGYICPDWCAEGRIGAELRRGVVFGRR